MTDISKRALALVLPQFKLDPKSQIHGIPHWSRVAANGRALCNDMGATLSDRRIVEWFAYLHDACRENDDSDPEHGTRAVALACTARDSGLMPELTELHVDLLCSALAGHSSGATRAQLVIQICWDADRLDLPRVGTTPDPARMCTSAGRRIATQLATQRQAQALRHPPPRHPSPWAGTGFKTIQVPRCPGKPRRTGSYATAVQWIADEDDNEWLDDPNGSPSVTASLVADLFGRTTDEVTKDLRKLLKK